MLKGKAVILLMASALLSAAGAAEEPAKFLTLEDCILSALKNNIGVAIQVLNPELADVSVSLAREKFIPSLSFGFNKRNTNSASYSWIDAAEKVKTKYDDYSVEVKELIPTGGSLQLSLDSYKNFTTQQFQTINPRYGSTLRLNFVQPLLKDFGFKTSRREILVAANNFEISQSQFEKTLLDTIYNVEEAYWNLVYSIQDFEARKQSLKLAQDFLEKNRRSVEIGTLAPIEILSAEAEVATREADILQAEALVKSNEDRLKVIINLSPEKVSGPLAMIPTDKPTFERRDVDLEQSLAIAMTSRPDLQAIRLGLKNNELNLSYARNQMLPGLNLTASYWSPGVSGDQLLYDGNPIFGKLIGTIPGGASEALNDTFKFKYRNWSVGLILDIPLSSIFSKAAYAQAKVSLEQAVLNLKNQEQQAYLEIENAVRAVQTDFKRVQAYKIARELAERKLQAEEEKLKVGLSTNFVVLTYQRDLSNARSSELKATIDYNLSLANLDRATGTSLAKKNIRVSDYQKNG